MSKRQKTSAELRAKIEALKAEEKEAKKREEQQEKEASARRRERIGEVVEAVYQKPLTDDQIPAFRAWLEDQQRRGQYLSKAIEATRKTEGEQENDL